MKPTEFSEKNNKKNLPFPVIFLKTFFSGFNFNAQKDLQQKNEMLLETNKKLEEEIKKYKNATQKFHDNQQFLDKILTNAPLVIWSVDTQGIFTYSQYKGEKGVFPGDRLGKSALEIYKGTEVELFIRKVIKGEIMNDIILVDSIYYDTRVSPIYNEKNELTGYLGVSMDISKRVKSERELKKFRQVIDQAPGAVFIMDKNSNFEYINPFFTQISGYTEEDLLHKNINDTLYKGIKDIPESRKEIISSLSEGKSWQGELLTIHKNGSKYWANTIAAPFKNDLDETDGFIVIQQDATERKSFEKALKESELKYKTLVENSLEGITIIRDNKILFANDTYCNMLGYSREELYNMPSVNTLHPDDHGKAFKIAERRHKKDFSTIQEVFRMITKKGEIKECETSSTLINFNGEWASFFTSRDISENKKMQKALQQSEEKYKALVENSQDGIIITQDGKFKFANAAMCKMLGYSLDEFYQMEGIFLVPENKREQILKIHKERMKGNVDSLNYTTQFISKSGKLLDIEVQSSTLDFDGKPAAFMTLHNITESKKMQQALRESEEKYRTLIDKALDGIIITQNGRFKFVNHAFCEMMQYEVEELIGQPFLDYVEPEDHEVMLNYHKRRMAGEDFQAIYRSRIKRKDGKFLQVELNTRTSEYDGQPAAFIITRDITARLKTEEELRDAKEKLEMLNQNLEFRIQESSLKLTEANTQLIQLQKENLQSQFEVLRQQVNPHFLFNSLNVLTSLIKLEPDLAEKFTEHLSKVYRYVLENKDNDLVNLQTELDFLDAYIFLLNIRFMDKIEIMVSIPENRRKLLILPLALQLLIENAIKHNSMSKKNPLRIEIFIDENHLLNVVNNLQERESHMASTGVGLKNIEHRYYLLEMPNPCFIKTETQFIAQIPLKNEI